MLVGADVKCYFCGHISGRLEGDHMEPLLARVFRPREGYRGQPPRPGQRLRCERCNGPVYLEDVRAVYQPQTPPRGARRRPGLPKAA